MAWMNFTLPPLNIHSFITTYISCNSSMVLCSCQYYCRWSCMVLVIVCKLGSHRKHACSSIAQSDLPEKYSHTCTLENPMQTRMLAGATKLKLIQAAEPCVHFVAHDPVRHSCCFEDSQMMKDIRCDDAPRFAIDSVGRCVFTSKCSCYRRWPETYTYR